ncbi:MAG: DapA [Paenibacillaceae bacterium]|nr:DapA [Paenibacillaceae bacterium]
MDFGRLVTAAVTPFNDQLRIDWARFDALIDYLIEEQQSDSLVICGTTGESPTLSDEEKLQLFAAAVKQAAGRCKIIAGTGSFNTEHVVHLTKEAEATGVDGILLVSPYYSRPSQEGLYQHFRTVSECTDLPIMLYNVPTRTGVNVSAETTLRLAELPNVIASKEAISDFSQLSRMISGASAKFKVYSGDDILTLPALSIGCYGIVSVASHLVGARMKRMIEAYLRGEVAEAARIHGQLHPVFSGLFSAPSPAPTKYALNRKGVQVGGVRLPLVELDESEQRYVDSLFGY